MPGVRGRQQNDSAGIFCSRFQLGAGALLLLCWAATALATVRCATAERLSTLPTLRTCHLFEHTTSLVE